MARKTKSKIICSLVAASMVLSSLPLSVFADESGNDDSTEATTAVVEVAEQPSESSESDGLVVTVDDTTPADENVTSIPEDESVPADAFVEEDEEVPIAETSELSVDEGNEPSDDTAEVIDSDITSESDELDEDAPEDVSVEETDDTNYIVFDHLYSDVDVSVVGTSDLFVQTSDASVFTYNTNVVSNYDDVYVIQCGSVEEAQFVYSYYIDKVEYISDMSNIISVASEEESDVADLSDINNGEDAIANLSEITTSDYSGYIALIDTGADADVNFSVIGDDTSDSTGHGSRMLECIKDENPDALVMSIKVFNGSTASVADVYAGIRLAIDSNVSVINLSLVGPNVEKNSIIKEAIQEALDAGIVVIGAAGNNNSSAYNYIPGCIDGVITVGAVNADGTKFSTSNYNADLYVVSVSTSEAAARYSGIYTAGVESDKVFNSFVEESSVITPADVDGENVDLGDSGYAIIAEDGTTYYFFSDGMALVVDPEGNVISATYSSDFTTADPGTYTSVTDLGETSAAFSSDTPNGYDYGVVSYSAGNAGFGSVSNFRTSAGDNVLHISDFVGGASVPVECEGHDDDSTESWHADALRDDNDSMPYYARYRISGPDDSGKIYIHWVVQITTDGINSDGTFQDRDWDTNNATTQWRIVHDDAAGGMMTTTAYYRVDCDSDNEDTSMDTGDWVLIDTWGPYPSGQIESISSTISGYISDSIRSAIPVPSEYNGVRNVSYPSFPTALQVRQGIMGASNGVYTSSSSSFSWETCDQHQIYEADINAWRPQNLELNLAKVVSAGYDCVTDGNSCYSLAGTTYKLYDNEDCTGTALATFTFDANGNMTGDPFVISSFDDDGVYYYIKETTAGPGFTLDTRTYCIEVTGPDDNIKFWHRDLGSTTWVAYNDITVSDSSATITMGDIPMFDPLNISLTKVDESGHIVDANVSGASFAIEYYAQDLDQGSAIPNDLEPTCIYTFTISGTSQLVSMSWLVNNGTVDTSYGTDPSYFSDIIAAGITRQFPLGTYIIYETEAPDGYEISHQVFRVRLYDGGAGQVAGWSGIDGASERSDIQVRHVWDGNTLGLTWPNSPTPAYYSLVKEFQDYEIRENAAGMTFELWNTTGNVKVATGVSDEAGHVLWTYVQPNLYSLTQRDDDSANGRRLLTGTRTYTLELAEDNNYQVREIIPNDTFATPSLTYYYRTPTGWSRANTYFYKNLTNLTADALFADTMVNDIEYAYIDVHKGIPANDTFDMEKVQFELWETTTNTLIATGEATETGEVNWTLTSTQGSVVDRYGAVYVDVIAHLPTKNASGSNYQYEVREIWDKTYIASLDGATEIELFETNNAQGWVRSETDETVTYTRSNITLSNENTFVLRPVNDEHVQWFNLMKQITVAGDAGTVEFMLYMVQEDGSLVWMANGTCETDGTVGYFPVTWNSGYETRIDVRNGKDVMSLKLPEGQYRVVELYTETYYQPVNLDAGVECGNIPYSYMCPADFVIDWNDDGTHPVSFHRDFNIGNNATTPVQLTATNRRIEITLDVRKMEQLATDPQSFTFEIYYRGNEAEPQNVGDFSSEYLLDTITVNTEGGSGSASLSKIPEGWYEVVEVSYPTWGCQWMGSASTITADGKLIHAQVTDLTATNNIPFDTTSGAQTASNSASLYFDDGIRLFGTPVHGILAFNTFSTDVTVIKVDSWTYEAIATADQHPDDVHLTFHLYVDADGDKILDPIEEYGYQVRVDGADEGSVVYKDLPIGNYILREVATVNGYYLTAPEIAFSVPMPEDSDYTVYPANQPYTEPVRVTKIDNETEELLSGASFNVYFDSNDNGVWDAEDQIASVWIDANDNGFIDENECQESPVFGMTSTGVYESAGEYHFNDGFIDLDNDGMLDEGHFGNRYFIVETSAPANYFFVNEDGTFTADSVYREFVINAADTTAPDFQVGTQEFTFSNQTGTVYVHKVNEEGEFLTGATFAIYADADCTEEVARFDATTAVTIDGEQYYTYRGLGLGTYYLKEVQAPVYYEVDPNAYAFSITTEGTKNGFNDGTHPLVDNVTWDVIAGVQGDFLNHNTITQTTLTDDWTLDHVGVSDIEVNLTDRVEYRGLILGETYTMTGTLYDQKTGENVLDAEGNPVVSSVTFVADGSREGDEIVSNGLCVNGYIDVPFNFTIEDGAKTRTWVAGEQLERQPENRLVGIHYDLEDKPQTVWYPAIHTTLVAEITGDHVAPQGDTFTLVDTVTYENLVPGLEYTMTGTLMDKSTGEALLDIHGNEITASTVFTPTAKNGTVDVTFVFDAEILESTTLVAFESLIYTNVEGDDVVVATHNDINDVDQTVNIPDIGTTFYDRDLATEPEMARSGREVELVDTVHYENITPGLEYTLFGTIMVKETGRPLMDAEGNVVVARTTFTPTTATGDVEVVFTVDTTICAGQTLVAFETLEYNGITLVVHADINDANQTVKVPDIGTTFYDRDFADEPDMAQAMPDTTLVDTVEYENLVVGKTYTITGTIMVKETGLALTDADGNVITSSVTFVPTTASGSVEVEFTIDTSLVAGKTLVAFETLTYEGVEVVIHADIDDENQTIRIPEIHTTLKDTETDGHVARVQENVTLVDTVFYQNLVVGKEYTITGTLMNRATGEAILDAENKPVTASTTFVAEAASDLVEIEFTVDGRLLQGVTVVAFETVSYEGIDIAIHADIEDEAQTVYFPDMGTTATVDGKKIFTPTDTITLTDVVAYENLVPDETYELRGTVMVKGTGEALKANGMDVVSVIRFTPTEASGTVSVTFVFTGENLTNGEELVVFEDLYLVHVAMNDNGELEETTTLILTHEDLTDTDQTVTVSIPPKTGDLYKESLWIAIAVISILTLAGVAFATTKLKKKEDIG